MTTATLEPAASRETVLTTTEFNNLVTTSGSNYSTATSFVDLAAGGLLPAYINVIIDSLVGAAGCTGNVDVYIIWADTTTSFTPVHSNAVRNGEWVMSVDMNGATEVDKVSLVAVKARYAAIVIVNNSGGTLAADAGDAYIRKVDVDNA